MSWLRATLHTAVALCALLLCSRAEAAPIFFGPSPYLSIADIPAGFYAGGPAALENFEDRSLDFGITSGGTLRLPASFTDSVDADDGVIDGFGKAGHSFLTAGRNITFTFTSPVSAAALVLTESKGPVTFHVFGANMVSLGSFGPFSLNDAQTTGQTAEDRFFGVHASGIRAIRLTSTMAGMEVDHVQFGNAGAGVPTPEPTALVLLGLALAVLGARRRPGTHD